MVHYNIVFSSINAINPAIRLKGILKTNFMLKNLTPKKAVSKGIFNKPNRHHAVIMDIVVAKPAPDANIEAAMG